MTLSRSRLLPALLGLALTCPAAEAAERRATAAEAARLEAAGADYFGRAPRGESPILRIRPEADHYRGTLDLGLGWKRLFGAAPPRAGAKDEGLTLGQATFTLEPLADGRWKTKIDGLPTVRYTGANRSYELLHEGVALEAITDPATGALVSLGGRIDHQTETDDAAHPNQGTRSRTQNDHTGITLRGSTRPTHLPGVVDLDIPAEQAAQTTTFDITWDERHKMPPVSVRFTSGHAEGALRAHGLRLAALLDVWRHAPKPGRKDGGGKTRGAETPTAADALIDALPWFDDASLTMVHTDVSIVTAFATVLAKTFEFEMDGTGVVHRGMLHLRATAREMKIASMLIPSWAVPMLPSEATFEFRISGFDYASAVTYSLGRDGKAGGDAAAEEKRRAELFLPSGKFDADFSGTRVVGDGWSMAMEMHVELPGDRPKGEMTLRARGLDRVLETVRAASASDPRAVAFAEELEMVMARAEKVGDEWIIHHALDRPKKPASDGTAPATPPAAAPSPSAPAPTTAPPAQ